MAPIKFLITGSTSGLGASILQTLYNNLSASSADLSTIAASSSRASAGPQLQEKYPGIQFRTLNYDDRGSLVQALEGVERFFFVSSPEGDTVKRNGQHENVVMAAKEAGVGHVYYSSLAMGGYGMDSEAVVQQAHLVTERLLKESGLNYTAVREGIYIDAFPFFVFWYPGTTTIYQPGDGPVAFASRSELGEATANLMLRDPSTLNFKNNIALLTGSRTYTFTDVVKAISEASGTDIKIEKVSKEDFPRILAEEDLKEGKGRKSEAFFAAWQSVLEGFAKGEAAVVDPLMGELLGREPRDAMQFVKELVREGAKTGGYTWHQNYTWKS